MSMSELLEQSKEKAILVDFHAKWCEPCRKMWPIINEVAEENSDKLDLIAVDVDESMDTAKEFGVMGVPTVILLKDGEIIDKFVGGRGKADVDNFISTAFK